MFAVDAPGEAAAAARLRFVDMPDRTIKNTAQIRIKETSILFFIQKPPGGMNRFAARLHASMHAPPQNGDWNVFNLLFKKMNFNDES